MLKTSFILWSKIAIFMFFVINIGFILFLTLIQYWHLYMHVKAIFISIFVITLIISFFVINYFFKNEPIFKKNKITFNPFKLYFSLFLRAMVFVIPAVGLIAYTCHGSITSRFFTILIEILLGFPAIYWYIYSLNKKHPIFT